MRTIPKDTKVKNYIWKRYALFDVLVFSIFLAISGLFLLTKIKLKIVPSIIFLILGVIMLVPTFNNSLVYKDILIFFKFIFSKKEFKNDEIKKLVPFDEVLENGDIKYFNNYYGSVYEIGAKDFSLEDIIGQNMDISFFANALNTLDTNIVLDIIKLSRPIILDEEVEKLKILIDREKDKNKKKLLNSKLNDLIALNDNDDPIYKPYFYFSFYAPKKELLEINIENFFSIFKNTKLNVNKLDRNKVLIFLKYSFFPKFDERELYNKDLEIKDILPKNIKFQNKKYLVDNKEVINFSICDYPLEVKNGYLNQLFNIDDTKVIVHINGVNQEKAIRRIDKTVNEIKSRYNQVSKTSDEISNDTHFESMVELLYQLQTENEKLFDVSIVVSAYRNEEIEKENLFRKKIRTLIRNSAFNVNSLINRQIDGYINSNLSYSTVLKKEERGISSSSLAASFPFIQSLQIDKDGDYIGYTDDNLPILLNIWKRDGEHQNSNAFIAGSSGSGKSFFLKTLISNVYARNSKIYILDPENEYKILSENLNGEMIDVGRGDIGRINPFHVYKTVMDKENNINENKSTFLSHLRLLESFFQIIFNNIEKETLEIINNLVAKTYKEKNIDENTDFIKLNPEDFPTFEDLYIVLKKEISKNSENKYRESIYLSAKTYIEKFTKGGRYSDLWNGKSTFKTEKDIAVFNFQSLFAAKNNQVANAQMLLIFRFLEQEIINQKNINEKLNLNLKTTVIVDEAHMFIDSKFPIALDFMYQMTKRIRKYGGSFIAATQSISDWNSTEELRNKTTAILKNSQYSFIFKLKGADIEDLKAVYKSTPLNSQETYSIATASVGECFLIANETRRINFKVDVNNFIRRNFEYKNEKI